MTNWKKRLTKLCSKSCQIDARPTRNASRRSFWILHISSPSPTYDTSLFEILMADPFYSERKMQRVQVFGILAILRRKRYDCPEWERDYAKLFGPAVTWPDLPNLRKSTIQALAQGYGESSAFNSFSTMDTSKKGKKDDKRILSLGESNPGLPRLVRRALTSGNYGC